MTKIKAEDKKPREMIGTLVSINGENTLKIRVDRKFPHKKYGKIVKSHKNYLADFRGNKEDLGVGDVIKIVECKPVSQKKTWKFVSVEKKSA